MFDCNHSGEKGNFCTNCGTMLKEPFPLAVSPELRQLCQDWHGGQWTAMYSVSSTGHVHNRDILSRLLLELVYEIRETKDSLLDEAKRENAIATKAYAWLDAFNDRLPQLPE